MEKPTLPIELELEQSGVLCHALMAYMAATSEWHDYLAGKPVSRPLQRILKLYDHLATLNDKLMGK